MSPEFVGIIGLVVLVILLLARMWIGAAMALVGFGGYAIIMGIDPAFSVISVIPFSTMSTYMMTTVIRHLLTHPAQDRGINQAPGNVTDQHDRQDLYKGLDHRFPDGKINVPNVQDPEKQQHRQG